MTGKSLRKKRAEDRQIRDELTEYDAQVRQAVSALNYLLGIDDEGACLTYNRLHSDFEHYRMAAASQVARLFPEKSVDYGSQAGKALKSISDFKQSLERIAQDPIAQLILEKEFEYSQMGTALARAGVSSDKADYNEQEATLNELTVFFINEMDRFQLGNPLAPVEALLATLAKTRKEDKDSVRYFLDDLIENLGNRSEYYASTIRMGRLISKSNPYSFAARSIVSNTDETKETIEEMLKLLPDYRTIAKADLLTSSREWTRNGTAIQGIAQQIRNLSREGINERELGNLILGIHAERREELFWMVAENPEYGKFWIAEKRHQIPAAGYGTYLLELANSRMTSGITSFEFLQKVAKTKGHAGTVKYLVATTYDWVIDPEIEDFFERVKNHPSGEEIIRKYLHFGEQKSPHIQTLVREILNFNYLPLDQKQFRLFLEGLNYLSDSQVGEIINSPNVIADIRALSSKQHTIAVVPKSERRNWLEVMVHEHPGLETNLKEAHTILQTYELEDRLRNMWRTQPASLPRFAQEVVAYRANVRVFDALKNNSVYNAVKEWQKEHPRDSFGKVIESFEGDYSELRKLFGPVTAAKQNLEEKAEETLLAKLKINKVIIWGDTYTAEMRNRIKEELDRHNITPVFYDRFKRAKYANTDADAVIWVTPYSEHSGYYAVKTICSRNSVPFFHMNRPGAEAVIKFINEIAA